MTFVVSALGPVPALAQEGEKEISDRFEEMMVLKSRGEYDRAVDELGTIIDEFEGSERVLRLAYSYLVAVYHEANDTDGARRAAKEALERFPDITAGDEITIPPLVDEYYDTLRREMFGSLSITEPQGCDVFLNGDPVGQTPLDLVLVRAGAYDLNLTKNGYHDYAKNIVIEPDRLHVEAIQMKRARTKWWWIARGAVVVTGVVIVALLLWPPDDQLPELEDPPNPP